MSEPVTIDVTPGHEHHDAAPHCPKCGSQHVTVISGGYDPGCGCLGLLLFGWIGLLWGLLGLGNVQMACAKCGARWPVGQPRQTQAGCGGCLSLLLLVLVIAVVMTSCNCFAG